MESSFDSKGIKHGTEDAADAANRRYLREERQSREHLRKTQEDNLELQRIMLQEQKAAHRAQEAAQGRIEGIEREKLDVAKGEAAANAKRRQYEEDVLFLEKSGPTERIERLIYRFQEEIAQQLAPPPSPEQLLPAARVAALESEVESLEELSTSISNLREASVDFTKVWEADGCPECGAIIKQLNSDRLPKYWLMPTIRWDEVQTLGQWIEAINWALLVLFLLGALLGGILGAVLMAALGITKGDPSENWCAGISTVGGAAVGLVSAIWHGKRSRARYVAIKQRAESLIAEGLKTAEGKFAKRQALLATALRDAEKEMLKNFREGKFTEGVIHAVRETGHHLMKYFPNQKEDTHE